MKCNLIYGHCHSVCVEVIKKTVTCQLPNNNESFSEG